MPVRRSALLTLATCSLLLSPSGFAKTIYNSGDWSLDDSQPGVLGKGNCVAATATYLGNYGAYSLNVVLDKSGTHPIELVIRPFRSPSKAQSFRVMIDSGRTYTFVKLPASSKGEDTFWNLPRGTDKFIAQLKAAAQLSIAATNDMGELPFSMNGASSVLAQLEKRCVANPEIATVDFEKNFLPTEVNTVDFSQVDQPKAGELRDIVTRGAAAYRGIDAKKAELSALEARYAKLQEEKLAITESVSQLFNRDLPALRGNREGTQAKIDAANVEIAAFRASIAGQQSVLVSAEAANAAANSAIQPIMPEHNRLAAKASDDDKRRASAEAALASGEQALALKNQELADRMKEAESLRTKIASTIEETRRARTSLSEAEKSLRGFDPISEVKRKRESDRRLVVIEKDLRTLFQTVQTSEQALASATTDQTARAAAAQTCEKAGATDCTAQRSELSAADQRLDSARQNLTQAQTALQARSGERDNIQREIEQAISSQREEIAHREAEARRYVTQLESGRDQMDSRVRDLNQYVIPATQTELGGLQTQRKSAADILASARAALNVSSAALAKFEASVKFAVLNGELLKTANRVTAVKEGISGLNSSIKNREQLTVDQAAARVEIEKKIAKANESIQQKNSRLEAVNQSLLSYKSDRKAAEESILSAKNALTVVTQEFALKLPQVAKP